MVAMEMANENLIYFLSWNGETLELCLNTFPTINKDVMFLDIEVLGGGEPSVGRQRTA